MTLLSLLFSVLILAGCVYFYMVFQLPDVQTLNDTRLQIPLRIYSSDGQLIGEYGAMRRNPVTLPEVPKPLLQGLIATEDQRFFEHPGVDFIGILRAARELIITGQKSQGASTITMQVARNFFLTPEKTFSRKINEILLALKINSTFSKEKILELYINKIYLGQHAYGVSAAAQIYYGKSLNELTLAEMAMIAGLPQAPSKENPITDPKAAKVRRDHVLQRMLELGYISKDAYQQAVSSPVETYYHGPKTTVLAPHMAEMVRNVVYQQFGDDGYTNGLSVYTTINSTLQAAANAALRNGLVDYERRHKSYRGAERNLGHVPARLGIWQDKLSDIPIENDLIPAAVMEVAGRTIKAMLVNGGVVTIPWSGMAWTRRKDAAHVARVGDVIRVVQQNGQWQLAQTPKVEGAIVALNPDDGAVWALVGGLKDSETGLNRAIQANRQPGSSFKPFIYAAALAKGFTLSTVINDAPIAINDTGDPNNLWRPGNDDGIFHGPTRVRLGLVHSYNVLTVRLLQLVGIPYALDYISRFGFDKSVLPPSLSLALGTAQVTPLQMAAGYAVFANGGYRINPYFIQYIKAADGKIVYAAHQPVVPGSQTATDPASPPAPRAIDADIAYLVTNVLQDVIKHGTGYAATVLKRDDLAGKTGTTQRQVDAWFSGFNRRIVTTVWVGYDQPKPLYEHGAQAALPVWIEFMRAALTGTPEQTLSPPDDIVTARIDPDTGQLAADPDQNAIFELFKADNLPKEGDGEDGSMDAADADSTDGTNSEARIF
ncbi:MAG TPA: penicillin-binding protein 1A [Gammaproteobacteria bacterium]|nr:penicillin-binding protein 1A [Gammaproteobacteria bacterium]